MNNRLTGRFDYLAWLGGSKWRNRAIFRDNRQNISNWCIRRPSKLVETVEFPAMGIWKIMLPRKLNPPMTNRGVSHSKLIEVQCIFCKKSDNHFVSARLHNPWFNCGRCSWHSAIPK